jgi:UDP-GlcNAc:undecaprenyl-phosphate GlcNAc-1-phosphate transferase
MIYLLSLYFSVLLTTLLIPPFMKLGARCGMIDVPNARKVHRGIIPRTGGIALVIGTLIPLLFLLKASSLGLGICLGGMCIFIVGVLDDQRDLSYKWKFAGQIVGAFVLLLVSGLRLHSLGEFLPGSELQCGFMALPLSVFFLVATINIINLADGLDGLAGGICMLIFTSTGFLAYLNDDFRTLALCVCMVGAIIGFLRYNTHPAVVFLGDTGSQFLGFMVGVAMLLFTQTREPYMPMLAMFLIGIPVLDTAIVMIERRLEHKPLFKPDKKHLHHKLLGLGLMHHQAVVVIYATQLAMILLGWNLRHFPQPVLLMVYLTLISLFAASVIYYDRKRKNTISYPGLANVAANESINEKSALVFSRSVISRVAWSFLVTALFAFLLAAPAWARPIAKDIGVYSIIFMILLILLRFFKPDVLVPMVKMAGYFIALYYIPLFELEGDRFLYKPIITGAYEVIFFIIGVSYVVYLITTLDKAPVVTMDYLLLGVVVLTFFFPNEYLNSLHLHKIAAKVLIVFVSLELVAFKIRGKDHYLLAAMMASLGLSFAMAFWPWVF